MVQVDCGQQIAGQRFQNVLPGTSGKRVANLDRLTVHQRLDAVGDYPVLGPVTPADYVAGSYARRSKIRPILEKRIHVGREDHFRRRLRRAVGVVTAQFVVFPIPPEPLPVLVAFVRGHIDYRTERRCRPYRFQDVDRARYIGVKGCLRVFIGRPDQGLRRKMEEKFGLKLQAQTRQRLCLSDVARHVADHPVQTEQPEMVMVTFRGQRVADHLGAQFMKPETEP